jgi:hypothetical protein
MRLCFRSLGLQLGQCLQCSSFLPACQPPEKDDDKQQIREGFHKVPLSQQKPDITAALSAGMHEQSVS